MGTLSINTLGTAFTIQAGEDTEYLAKLLGYFERISNQIKDSGILKDNTQIAIMSGIMLCDELYKEKSRKISAENGVISEFDLEAEEELERRTQEMIRKIDQVL
ncbi:MAG: cell division protein ZapA [Treponema sp.]|nr:cell division protein ZapA [Treponema sp.]